MKPQINSTTASAIAVPLSHKASTGKGGFFKSLKSLSLGGQRTQRGTQNDQPGNQQRVTMQDTENSNQDPSVLTPAFSATTTTFQKRNGLSITKYGHICLPKKQTYEQFHAAWGKTKTAGTCTIGASTFECYIDWVESKKVWMLRLKKAASAFLEFRNGQTLHFLITVHANSFELLVLDAISELKNVNGDLEDPSLVARQKPILPFEEARRYVRALGLTSMQDWISYSKSGYRPKYIPSNPWIAYKGDYLSINDFIGGKAPRRNSVRTASGAGR